jgi:hypothetical protein
LGRQNLFLKFSHHLGVNLDQEKFKIFLEKLPYNSDKAEGALRHPQWSFLYQFFLANFDFLGSFMLELWLFEWVLTCLTQLL